MCELDAVYTFPLMHFIKKTVVSFEEMTLQNLTLTPFQLEQ